MPIADLRPMAPRACSGPPVLDERNATLRQMAVAAQEKARRQRLDAIRRRDEARQRAGQRIVPMWRARKAAYDRFGPVTAVWPQEEPDPEDQVMDGAPGVGYPAAPDPQPAPVTAPVAELVNRLFEVSLLLASCQSAASDPLSRRMGEAVAAVDRVIRDLPRALDARPGIRAIPRAAGDPAPDREWRPLAAYGAISESLIRGTEPAEVLDLVVEAARVVFDGRDAWTVAPTGDGRSASTAPAIEAPISSNGEIIAVLCVSSPDGSPPTDGEVDDVERFASMVSVIMGLARERAERESQLVRLSGQLQHALDSRVVVEQAKGILAAGNGIGVEVAFERIRRHARSHHTTVHEVAAAVVNLGLRL